MKIHPHQFFGLMRFWSYWFFGSFQLLKIWHYDFWPFIICLKLENIAKKWVLVDLSKWTWASGPKDAKNSRFLGPVSWQIICEWCLIGLKDYFLGEGKRFSENFKFLEFFHSLLFYNTGLIKVLGKNLSKKNSITYQLQVKPYLLAPRSNFFRNSTNLMNLLQSLVYFDTMAISNIQLYLETLGLLPGGSLGLGKPFCTKMFFYLSTHCMFRPFEIFNLFIFGLSQ